MSADPLALAATPGRVRTMQALVPLPAPALARALQLADASPDAPAWHRFLSRTLALLGAGLLLAGTVCFIAYNWERVGRFAKFGLIELAILAAALYGWRALPRFAGRLSLSMAAILVGPLLALYGQTYQTGADPYGLFVAWLVLIVPWVLAARFSPLTLFALGLLDVSVWLYWSQVIGGGQSGAALPMVLAAIHAAALVAWERFATSKDRRGPHLIATTGFLALLFLAVRLVFDDTPDRLDQVGMLAFAAAVAAMLYYYRRVHPSRAMVTIAVSALLLWITIGIGRVVFDLLNLEGAGFLVMAVLVLGEIALGFHWYRGASRAPAPSPTHGAR